MQNEFQAYSSVFILLDYMPFQVHSSDEIKEGIFACVYHHGPYEETDETYKKLIKYIDQEGYEVDGDSIEIALIDWSVTENPEEQVTEIQIPIMKKQSNKLKGSYHYKLALQTIIKLPIFNSLLTFKLLEGLNCKQSVEKGA